MRRAFALVVGMGLAAGGPLAACAAFDGEVEPQPPAGAPDGSAGIDVVAPELDAGRRDGDVPLGPRGPCAGQAGAVFCDDFESAEGREDFGWSYTVRDRDVTFSLERGKGRGGSTALRVSGRMRSGQGASSLNGYLGKVLARRAELLGATTLRAELWFDPLTSRAEYAVLGATALYANDELKAHHGVAARTPGRYGATGDPAPGFVDGVGSGWHHAVMVLARDGTAYKRSVTVDGVAAGAESISFAALPEDAVGIFQLGVFFTDKAGGELDILYDDILVATE